jgi:hypothetical protein
MASFWKQAERRWSGRPSWSATPDGCCNLARWGQASVLSEADSTADSCQPWGTETAPSVPWKERTRPNSMCKSSVNLIRRSPPVKWHENSIQKATWESHGCSAKCVPWDFSYLLPEVPSHYAQFASGTYKFLYGVILFLLLSWHWFPTGGAGPSPAQLFLFSVSVWTLPDCSSHLVYVVAWINCRWVSPAQPFLVPSPVGLWTIFYCHMAFRVMWLSADTLLIQDIPVGKVNILGRHSIEQSEQKIVLRRCVLLRTVSEIVHCTLYRRATRHVLTGVAKCIDVDGGIFGNVLY